MALRSDRTYRVPASPTTVWAALTTVDDYPSWWPWLERFDADALEPGTTWQCSVRSPLRIVLHFTITVHTVAAEIAAPHHVTASLAGDIDGPAALTLVPRPDGGTDIRLCSALVPRSSLLAVLTSTTPPLARWAHNRLLDTGATQFADALCGRGSGASCAPDAS